MSDHMTSQCMHLFQVAEDLGVRLLASPPPPSPRQLTAVSNRGLKKLFSGDALTANNCLSDTGGSGQIPQLKHRLCTLLHKPADNRREHSTRRIVTIKTSIAHTTAAVNDERSHFNRRAGKKSTSGSEYHCSKAPKLTQNIYPLSDQALRAWNSSKSHRGLAADCQIQGAHGSHPVPGVNSIRQGPRDPRSIFTYKLAEIPRDARTCNHCRTNTGTRQQSTPRKSNIPALHWRSRRRPSDFWKQGAHRNTCQISKGKPRENVESVELFQKTSTTNAYTCIHCRTNRNGDSEQEQPSKGYEEEVQIFRCEQHVRETEDVRESFLSRSTLAMPPTRAASRAA